MRTLERLQGDLAMNLKLRRVELGFSQEEVAALSGIERARVGQIERGEANPTLRSLASLAAAVQLDPAELLKARAPLTAPRKAAK